MVNFKTFFGHETFKQGNLKTIFVPKPLEGKNLKTFIGHKTILKRFWTRHSVKRKHLKTFFGNKTHNTKKLEIFFGHEKQPPTSFYTKWLLAENTLTSNIMVFKTTHFVSLLNIKTLWNVIFGHSPWLIVVNRDNMLIRVLM